LLKELIVLNFATEVFWA